MPPTAFTATTPVSVPPGGVGLTSKPASVTSSVKSVSRPPITS